MKQHLFIPSTDGKTNLHTIIWRPNGKPKAIIQLIHGMAEYIDRYDSFARYLVQQQFLVIGHDHLGHGRSINSQKPVYGFFNKNNGREIIVNDCLTVQNLIHKQYPNLSIYALGHSMGSFILRNFLTQYSDHLSGVILMGTGNDRKDAQLILPLLKILNQTAPYKVNKQLDKLAFGSFKHSFKDNPSNFSWLSKNPVNVENYEKDQQMGFIFTNNGFYTLMNLIIHSVGSTWYQPITHQLPILIISGEMDPVGQYGKGPRRLAQELHQAGFEQVTLQLYYDLRHEILNEEEADYVMNDISTWLNKHL